MRNLFRQHTQSQMFRNYYSRYFDQRGRKVKILNFSFRLRQIFLINSQP